jgi:hypothetical protein
LPYYLLFIYDKVLNEHAINLSIEITLLSKSNSKIIGFNSLKSYASVNHLHLHLVFLDTAELRERECSDMEFSFPIQNVVAAYRLAPKLWFISEESYFTPALALQLCDFQNNIEEFAK